jgi:enoyl-CoA hydratase/carnithine racemase
MTAQDFTGFRVEAEGSFGSLVFTKGDRLNPLSTQTLLDMETAARWFDDQHELRVVVVRGEGRVFSAGADLSSFGPGGMADHPSHIAGDAGRRMADAMEAMRAITIAQIHGHCVGGALVVAATCDLRVAAEGTQFSIPEVDIGIPLAWGGINRLVREIGPALTKELVLTCRPFDADEAKAAGFLNRVVPANKLADVVTELAQVIAAKPAFAVQATKSATNEVTAKMVGVAGAWRDAEALMAGLRDPEGQAAAKAYLEERGR